jgi:hypothetical protein
VAEVRGGLHYPRSIGEFQAWFRTDATAWTTWSGCAGHMGSNAPGATVLEAGGRVIAGSCAPPAGTGPR